MEKKQLGVPFRTVLYGFLGFPEPPGSVLRRFRELLRVFRVLLPVRVVSTLITFRTRIKVSNSFVIFYYSFAAFHYFSPTFSNLLQHLTTCFYNFAKV